MEYFLIAIKAVVGLSILNVWLVNSKSPSKWRGGDASTIKEEFALYGLPDWSVYLVGFCKVSLGILLLLSITFVQLVPYAALGLAFFLCGSILMHLKIKDSWYKSFPAAAFLSLCLLLFFLS